jgi:hypothetical protein
VNYATIHHKEMQNMVKAPKDVVSRITKSVGGGVSGDEIGNLLDNFKDNILSSLNLQLDTMQANKRHDKLEL